MASRRSKQALVDDLIREFRVSGNQDSAFDSLAAERLGVNETDLRCLNIIEGAGAITAGELAKRAGLTNGAVTGVLDRLERTGFALRVADPADRRRVSIEVTPTFYEQAGRIWEPMAADWQSTLGGQFTVEELVRIADFLHATIEIGHRQLDRLREVISAGEEALPPSPS